jgi:hypothetical protein
MFGCKYDLLSLVVLSSYVVALCVILCSAYFVMLVVSGLCGCLDVTRRIHLNIEYIVDHAHGEMERVKIVYAIYGCETCSNMQKQ